MPDRQAGRQEGRQAGSKVPDRCRNCKMKLVIKVRWEKLDEAKARLTVEAGQKEALPTHSSSH